MAEGLRRRDALHVYRLRGGGVNMAPMVDVVLVILIFFMAATKFAGEEWLLRSGVTEEASAAGSERVALPEVVLRVRVENGEGEGEVVNGEMDAAGGENGTRETGNGMEGGAVAVVQGTQRMRLSELTGWMAAFVDGVDAGRVAVVIDAGDDVAWELLVKAHEACLSAGIEKVAIGG